MERKKVYIGHTQSRYPNLNVDTIFKWICIDRHIWRIILSPCTLITTKPIAVATLSQQRGRWYRLLQICNLIGWLAQAESIAGTTEWSSPTRGSGSRCWRVGAARGKAFLFGKNICGGHWDTVNCKLLQYYVANIMMLTICIKILSNCWKISVLKLLLICLNCLPANRISWQWRISCVKSKLNEKAPKLLAL